MQDPPSARSSCKRSGIFRRPRSPTRSRPPWRSCTRLPWDFSDTMVEPREHASWTAVHRRRRYAVRPLTQTRGPGGGMASVVTRPAIPDGIKAAGVVAIGRRVAADHAPRIVEALAAGGVKAFELTLNDPEADALRSIEAVARVAGTWGVYVGAGTVLSPDAARRAIDAGATFLVMPHLDMNLV